MGKRIEEYEEYFYWVDMYFDVGDFDILVDGTPKGNINEIKILTSVTEMDSRIKNHFLRFKEQMKNNNIQMEMRTIIDFEIFKNHARWLISKNKMFNTMSGDAARRGQYEEIRETQNHFPLEKWWKNSLNIIEKSNEIKQFDKNTRENLRLTVLIMEKTLQCHFNQMEDNSFIVLIV